MSLVRAQRFRLLSPSPISFNAVEAARNLTALQRITTSKAQENGQQRPLPSSTQTTTTQTTDLTYSSHPMQGDFRYISRAELTRIGEAALETHKLTDLLAAVPAAYRQGVLMYRGTRMFPGAAVWAKAVAAGGALGDAMRSKRIASVVGNGACRTLFVHAGMLPAMMKVRRPSRLSRPHRCLLRLCPDVSCSEHSNGQTRMHCVARDMSAETGFSPGILLSDCLSGAQAVAHCRGGGVAGAAWCSARQ